MPYRAPQNERIPRRNPYSNCRYSGTWARQTLNVPGRASKSNDTVPGPKQTDARMSASSSRILNDFQENAWRTFNPITLTFIATSDRIAATVPAPPGNERHSNGTRTVPERSAQSQHVGEAHGRNTGAYAPRHFETWCQN